MSRENLTKFADIAPFDSDVRTKVRSAGEFGRGGSGEANACLVRERNSPVNGRELDGHSISYPGGEVPLADLKSIVGGVAEYKNFKSPFD